MRPILVLSALLLLLATPAQAQRRPLPRGCGAAHAPMLAGTPPDSAAVRCAGTLVRGIAARLLRARAVRDSASLDSLAGAAVWFRHPRLFRAELAVAGDHRAAEGARILALQLAFQQVQPYTMVQAREPAPPPPARCGRDAEGRPLCTVSSGGGECSIGTAKRAGFAVDRPIPASLRRELRSRVDALARDGGTSADLRRMARCIRQAWL